MTTTHPDPRREAVATIAEIEDRYGGNTGPFKIRPADYFHLLELAHLSAAAPFFDAERVREALAPFAKLADEIDEMRGDDSADNWSKACKWSDLERVREVYRSIPISPREPVAESVSAHEADRRKAPAPAKTEDESDEGDDFEHSTQPVGRGHVGDSAERRQADAIRWANEASAKTKDEAKWLAAALEAYHNSPPSSDGLARWRAAIAFYHLARFGGDPGEQLSRLRNTFRAPDGIPDIVNWVIARHWELEGTRKIAVDRIAEQESAITDLRSQLTTYLDLNAEQRARIAEQKSVLDRVEAWICNPVTSYSVAALDGLFRMTRELIAALQPKGSDGE